MLVSGASVDIAAASRCTPDVFSNALSVPPIRHSGVYNTRSDSIQRVSASTLSLNSCTSDRSVCCPFALKVWPGLTRTSPGPKTSIELAPDIKLLEMRRPFRNATSGRNADRICNNLRCAATCYVDLPHPRVSAEGICRPFLLV
jgi:hypothetical protein